MRGVPPRAPPVGGGVEGRAGIRFFDGVRSNSSSELSSSWLGVGCRLAGDDAFALAGCTALAGRVALPRRFPVASAEGSRASE